MNEICPENELWINEASARELGLKEGDKAAVVSSVGRGEIKVKVTDLIHPEAVFMLHGFGHEAKSAARSYNRGVSDAVLVENRTDMVGGSPALHDTFVTVTPA